eukprot:m.433847 g.433847  ORF g.433847 m.433847 type:complete len:170 (-) comp17630_c0_seq1:163-672(-)
MFSQKRGSPDVELGEVEISQLADFQVEISALATPVRGGVKRSQPSWRKSQKRSPPVSRLWNSTPEPPQSTVANSRTTHLGAEAPRSWAETTASDSEPPQLSSQRQLYFLEDTLSVFDPPEPKSSGAVVKFGGNQPLRASTGLSVHQTAAPSSAVINANFSPSPHSTEDD